MIELATDNLAALPADWGYKDFGNAAPASVYVRYWLVMSLAQLGRFAEATEHQAEAARLVEPTHHAFTIAVADILGKVQERIAQGQLPTATIINATESPTRPHDPRPPRLTVVANPTEDTESPPT